MIRAFFYVKKNNEIKHLKKEPTLSSISFYRHKFNKRTPSKNNVVFISAFFEFGCESLMSLYILPALLEKYRGKYIVVLGWYGRDFIYKDFVDEYWELKEEYQFLREHCRAFYHQSTNLKKLEVKLSDFGTILHKNEYGNIVCFPVLDECNINTSPYTLCKGRVMRYDTYQQCLKCDYKYPKKGIYFDAVKAKKTARWPVISPDKIEIAKSIIPPNAVGITARGRKTYGRNLTEEHYIQLIEMLKAKGYNPVWTGEKVSIMPCPCSDILDLSQRDEYRDLEQVLAYTSLMQFTIQYWTASTRLAGLVGTPYVIFESPDQIWGAGQEGYRLYLSSKTDKIKLVISHFQMTLKDIDGYKSCMLETINEIENDDYSIKIGLVENQESIKQLIRSKRREISWFQI